MGTTTTTDTYTTVDVADTVRRMKADLTMIADSTGGWSSEEVADYAHDFEELAKKGYLAWVDVTLLSGVAEIAAVRYDVDTDAGSLTISRPGGVLWPKVPLPRLRIVISYTAEYDADARARMTGRLRISWSPTNDDTNHATLNSDGGRNYVSNSFGIKRKDWSNP